MDGHRVKGYKISNDDLMLASLDHAMWFHRPFGLMSGCYMSAKQYQPRARAAWRKVLLHEQGELVCTVMQEGLIRVLEREKS